MTNETQKLNGKRRRWIIAGVLLLATSAATWWYWPRGDARFVGRWSLITKADGTAPELPFLRLVLWRHGLADITDPDGSNRHDGSWSATSRHFKFGPSYEQPLVLEIKSVNGTEIEFHKSETAGVLVLRRIPE
jgi:hypothetical protein